MDVSRKPAPDPAAFAEPLALSHALRDAVDRAGPPMGQLAVSVSGGPDSAMMAVALAQLAHKRRSGCGPSSMPHMIHVHHGLQDTADEWRDHVHGLAHRLRLPCHSTRVHIPEPAGTGLEAAARDARYEALADIATPLGITHILLAHHQDDQAETVLLRLLRGSGPAGLAAMAPSTQRQGLVYLRPWLDIPRVAILGALQRFTMATGWLPVYDPTNAQDRYTRSALRQRLAPGLDQRWPGWQGILGRHARLAAQTAMVLDEVAREDFAGLSPAQDGRSFGLAAWRGLSQARQAHVIRFWLQACGVHAPTEARLNELLRQLRTVHALGHDRNVQLRHAGHWIRCQKGRVILVRDEKR